MDRKLAYDTLLALMSEKTVQSIVDSLASAEYDRKEIERLVKLGERLQEATFTFNDKQLDKIARQLAGSIVALNEFLSTHYAPLDSRAIIFQLYPEHKYANEVKTADGGTFSWMELKVKGLLLGRKMKEDYIRLVTLYLHKDSPKSGARFPHKLPAGIHWENLIFALTKDETFRVQVGQFKEEVTYEEMGFSDERSGKPTIQWELLKHFAKYNGEIKATNPVARDNYKKQKQLLTQKLQQYFSIDFDPFEPYQGAYRAKFTIFIEGGE